MKQCFGKAHEDRLIPLMGRKRRRALSLPVPNYVVKLHCLVGLSPTPLPIAVIQDGTVLKQMDQPTSPAANPFRHSGWRVLPSPHHTPSSPLSNHAASPAFTPTSRHAGVSLLACCLVFVRANHTFSIGRQYILHVFRLAQDLTLGLLLAIGLAALLTSSYTLIIRFVLLTGSVRGPYFLANTSRHVTSHHIKLACLQN